jgi:hypothetical protein
MNFYLTDSTGTITDSFTQAEVSYRQSRVRDEFRRAGGRRHTWSADLMRRLTRSAPSRALALRPAPHH